MASSENPSKRERQKQRRNVKLEQQRAQEAKARRNRLLVFALLGLIFVGLIGASVANKMADNRAKEEQRVAVAAKLDDLGCTPDERQEDLGGGHLDGGALAQSPPDTLYPDRPASSGQHVGSVFMTGVYDQTIEERVLLHNLEHGYVNVFYTADAPEEQVTALKEYAQEQIDGPFKKIIVSQWDGEMSDPEANFAFTAWLFRQTCEEFDPDVFAQFLADHHSGAGEAPEKTVGASLNAESGIDPGDEPFLLPPLGGAGSPSESMTEGASDETTEAPAEDSS